MVKRFLVISLVLVLALVSTVSAQATTRTAIVGVDDVTVQVGQEFTVPVWINGVSNLYAADVRVIYDPAALQGVRVTRGTFLQPGFVVRQGFYGPPFCNPMCARYALTQLNPTPPVNGSGTLYWVTFKALRAGAANLTVYAELSAAGGIPIAVTTRSATVTVFAAQK